MTTDQGRKQLIEAAVAVVKRDGPEALSISATAAEAGVGYEQFRHCFPDDQGFIAELHQHYLDSLLTQISSAIGSLPPGNRRMRVGINRFLDVSLRRVRMRKALQRLRATSQALALQMNHRHRAFSHMIATELAASNWPHPVESARLLRTMIEEIARAEFAALRELPALRAALHGFIERPPQKRTAADTNGQPHQLAHGFIA